MVASTNRLEVTDPGGVRKLLYLIDPLRATPAGNLIYRQAEGMLDDIASSHLRSEMAYAGFVNVLLDAFNAHLTPGSTSCVQIKLLQARLQPPLTLTELDTLGDFINQCGDQIRDAGESPASIMLDAINPLLAAFGIDTVPADVAQPPEVETFSGDEPVAPEPERQDDMPANTQGVSGVGFLRWDVDNLHSSECRVFGKLSGSEESVIPQVGCRAEQMQVVLYRYRGYGYIMRR